MRRQLLLLTIFGIVVLFFILIMFCKGVHLNSNSIKKERTIQDWRIKAVLKYCNLTNMEVREINGIPTCYDNVTSSYLAYSLVLDAVIKECIKHSFECPANVINRGNPEVLKGSECCVIFFWGRGCPHCAREKPILETLHRKYNITVYMYEVYYSKENSELFKEVVGRLGVVPGVPLTIIGNYTFSGVLGDDELRYVYDFVS